MEIGIAGSMAGSVMAFLNCPIELLKVKLQTQDPKGVLGAKGKLEAPVSFRSLKIGFWHLLIQSIYSIRV